MNPNLRPTGGKYTLRNDVLEPVFTPKDTTRFHAPLKRKMGYKV